MFDMMIFLIELSVFFCIRKKRGDQILFNWNPQKVVISQHFSKDDLKPSIAHQVAGLSPKSSQVNKDTDDKVSDSDEEFSRY